jgi:hypothetical protein
MLEILIQSSWRQRHIIFQSFGDLKNKKVANQIDLDHEKFRPVEVLQIDFKVSGINAIYL